MKAASMGRPAPISYLASSLDGGGALTIQAATQFLREAPAFPNTAPA